MRSITFLGLWRHFWLSTLLGLCTAAAAQPASPDAGERYLLDLQHTRVHWEVMHFNTSTSRGRFDDISGQILFDRGSGRGAVSISVGTASVSSGVAPLDAMLRGSGFFDSAAHPRAEFVARDWRASAGLVQTVSGELTLRGVTAPLQLRATRFACRPHPQLGRELCGGDFEATLMRSEWGVSYGLPMVADRVRLVIQVEAVRDATP